MLVWFICTKLQQELLQAHGTVRVQKYECRLWKSKKSSTAQDADGRSLNIGIAVFEMPTFAMSE